MPKLTLVAGPNGSGKSTISAATAPHGLAVIDPDAIARTLAPQNPSRAAFRAARRAIERCQEHLRAHESFLLESTLAGHGAISVLREASQAGYETFLIYVALGDPELQIERVRLRVLLGGHNIPDADIRRRYARSLARAPEALCMAGEAVVLDNAGRQPERMLMLRQGSIVWKATNLRPWVADLARRVEAEGNAEW